MRQELEDKLFSEFPEFFKSKDNHEISLMGFGFCCEDGWYDLIHKLCTDLKATLDDQDFQVIQVKEKFGGLRFYVGPVPRNIRDLIRKAEMESYRTCERCGNKGSMTIKRGYYQVLCEDCRVKAHARKIKNQFVCFPE
uniref:Uncharacterized protein n=1 Tax=viral metagenome TaxID=1070528 RepID=A0A6M3J9Q4_9ZZZZ